MPIDIDPSKVQWDESPQIDASKVQWDESSTHQTSGEQHPGVAGSVAAGLRGVREYLPFARDIGAGASALVKGVPFEEEKKRQEAMDVKLAEEHPYAYTAGEIAGGVGSMLAPEAAGLGLLGKGAKAEEAAANLISKAPVIGGSATEANILSGLGSGAVSGAAQGAIHGLGTGTTSEERLGHAGEEALEGAGAGILGSGVGHGLARGARKIGEISGLAEKISKPTAAELKQTAKTAYDKSKAEYLKIKSAPIRNLYNETLRAMEDKGFDPDSHKGIMPALRKLRDASSPQTLEQLDRMMRMATAPAKNWQKPEEQMMAGIFRNKIMNFLDTVKPVDLISKSGGPTDAMEAFKQGRQFWKQGSKMQLLDEARETAKLRAASTGSGGNFPNAYRQEVKKILQKAKKQGKLWTPDEQKAMDEFVRGGTIRNLLRGLEIFNPIGHRSVGSLEFLAGAMNPAHATTIGAAPIAGWAAGKGEQYLANKAAQELEDIVGAGGARSSVERINPMESIYGRTLGTSASMAPVITPEEDRTMRADGGKVGKKDYPAKRLSRVERALKRAQDAIALETKTLMDKPDEHIAAALRIAKDK